MESKMMLRKGVFVAVSLIFLSFLLVMMNLTPLWAADEFKLRYGTAYNEMTWIGKSAANWIAKVEKDTGGRVKIQPFFGGTLIGNKEAATEVRGGTVDIAHIAIIFDPAFGLLHKARSFMWGVGINNQKSEHLIYNDLNAKYGFEKPLADLKVTARHRMLPYQLITAKKAVRTLDDFKGLRLKASPQYVSLLKSLGAEGINLPTGELYVSLQKGIVDGVLFDFAAIKSFKLYEVAKYGTFINLASGVIPMEIMNQKSFDKFPADIKKIFDESLAFWEKDMYDLHVVDEDAGLKLGKDNGMEFFELSREDLKKFHELTYQAALEDAKALDKMGYPGTQIIEETKRLADKYGR
ncbi:MAG: TRAP transporter substrate-binding protein DctP [Deltaproteobacteria bacterium]|nr:TRAP transporter substrate-binding protein DctP [Deltaproteobacteria bacterium]